MTNQRIIAELINKKTKLMNLVHKTTDARNAEHDYKTYTRLSAKIDDIYAQIKIIDQRVDKLYREINLTD